MGADSDALSPEWAGEASHGLEQSFCVPVLSSMARFRVAYVSLNQIWPRTWRKIGESIGESGASWYVLGEEGGLTSPVTVTDDPVPMSQRSGAVESHLVVCSGTMLEHIAGNR